MARGVFFPSHFEEKTFSVATWGEKLVHIRASLSNIQAEGVYSLLPCQNRNLPFAGRNVSHFANYVTTRLRKSENFSQSEKVINLGTCSKFLINH